MRTRSTRSGLLALALVAALSVAASSAAAARKKPPVTMTASVNQCVSVSSPINSVNSPAGSQAGVARIPVDVPDFRGRFQNGRVTAVSAVGVRITHTFDGDLGLVLLAPNGGVVPLSLGRGGGGDDFGSGLASCGGTLSMFNDAATVPISAGTAPFAASFRPEQPLAGLIGEVAHGDWILLVTDGATGDNGFLNAFSLNLTYTYLVAPKSKKKKKKK